MADGFCPRCGTPLAGAVLDGLCPRCVAAGLGPESTTEDAVAVQSEPGPPPTMPGDGAPDPLPPPLHLGSVAGRWADRPTLPKIEGYDVLREVTHGGQGVVYQAVQRSTKRKVAIKLLLEGPFASRSSRRRFEREIELVVSLKHPNVIAVFDSGVTANGHAYYVMDYVRGVPVTQYVREKKLDLEKCLSLFTVACDAVNHAHQKGVIHRDLKPGNVLVDAEGNVRVLDFGLAKAMSEPGGSLVSATGSLVGTLPYMSPEQTRGNPDEIDTRTDVYSLGVVLYEMLTGHHPYPVKGDVAAVIRHIAETPPAPMSKAWTAGAGVPSPRSGRCPIGSDVETIVRKALSKERDLRYDTAGELARDVRRYLQDEPIQARRASTLYQLSRFTKRNKPLMAGLVGIVAVLILGIAATSWYALQAMRERDKKDALTGELQRSGDALSAANDDLRQAIAREQRLYLEARENLATGMALSGKTLYDARDYVGAWRGYARARAVADQFEIARPMPILTGMLEASQAGLPLLGSFGTDGGVGGFVGPGKVPAHAKEINAVVVCPDGRSMIACSEDWRIIRWDLLTGAPLREYDTKQGVQNRAAGGIGVNNLALDAAGKRLLAGDDACCAYLFDVETGALLKTLDASTGPGRHSVWAVDFSPDGRWAVTAGDERLPEPPKIRVLRLWDLDRPEKVLSAADSRVLDDPKGHTENIGGVAFLPDGKGVVSASHDGTVKSWVLETGAVRRTLTVGLPLNDVAVVPNSRYAISGTMAGHVFLMDLDTLEHNLVYANPEPGEGVWRVAASRDGKLIAAARQDGTCRVWESATLEPVSTLYGHTAAVMDVAFSPDGGVVVSGGHDRAPRAWAVPRRRGGGPAAAPAERARRANAVAVCDAPDRLVLTGLEDGSALLWDPAAEKPLWTWPVHDAPVRGVWLSATGRSARSVAADGTAAAWDVGGDAPVRPLPWNIGPVKCAAFTRDGRQLVSLSPGGALCRWDAESGERLAEVTTADAAGGATQLVPAPDGRSVFLGFGDGRVLRFGLESGAAEAVAVTQKGPVTALDLSPDGKSVVCGGEEADAVLRDVAGAGWDRRRFSARGEVTAAAFSPDGMCVVTGGADVALLAVWDFEVGDRYREFEKELRPLAGVPPALPARAAFGRWHAFRGRDAWALEMLKDAANPDPLLLARCHWRLGDTRAAREQFEAARARKQGPSFYIELCLRALRDPAGGTTRPTGK